MRVSELDNNRNIILCSNHSFTISPTLRFTFCSINERERVGSIFMNTKAWTLFSISLPRKCEGDPSRITNSETVRK